MSTLTMKDEHKTLAKSIIIPALDGLTYREAKDVLTFCEEVLRWNLDQLIINLASSGAPVDLKNGL